MTLGNSSAANKTTASQYVEEAGEFYTETTRLVTVTVQPLYLEEQSSPIDDHYVWAYQVRIENKCDIPIQLCARSWQIIDARGHGQEIHGAGVVGELPILQAQEVFEYTSGASLNTPSGLMFGQYQMLDLSKGKEFEVEIPAFSLDSPYQPVTLN